MRVRSSRLPPHQSFGPGYAGLGTDAPYPRRHRGGYHRWKVRAELELCAPCAASASELLGGLNPEPEESVSDHEGAVLPINNVSLQQSSDSSLRVGSGP